MGTSIPALGYPSRTAAIEALRAQQLGTHEIARKLGIAPKDVTALESSKERTRRQRGDKVGVRSNNTVEFGYDLRQALRPHAIKRDMSVEALARLILETVGYGDLVDAVLDDEKGGA